MIVNFEKGRQIFGFVDEIFQNELLNFANMTAPGQIEACVRAHLAHESDSAVLHLQALLGSAGLANKDNFGRKTRRYHQGISRVPQ